MTQRPDAGSRARTQAAKRGSKTTVTPADQQLDVRVFLAALAAGKSVPTALKMARLSERRVARWIAFNGLGPAVKKAKRKGWLAQRDPYSDAAIDGLMALNAALFDRLEQQTADRYASGDTERLHQMRMSGELREILDREAVASRRRFGKHELASRYERAMLETPRRPRPGPVDELLSFGGQGNER